MKVNQRHFFNFNYDEFVHIKYLKHLMRDVASIVVDNIPEHKTIDNIKFVTDKYGENELHIIYTDLDDNQHDQLMKPAITERVNELIDARFRWIETGDDPIKKLEIKDHYIKVTTPQTTADFIIPYVRNNENEMTTVNFKGSSDDYLTIELTSRQTGDKFNYELPTKINFDRLRDDYLKFKSDMLEWQQEVNAHLDRIDQKDREQDEHLSRIDQKDQEQDNHLTVIDAKNAEQDNRLTDIENKNHDQDNRLTDVENKNTEQDNSIKGLQDHQVDVDKIIAILQSKSHDFLKQLSNPDDFNNITDDGNYFVFADNTPDNQLTSANRPSGHWGILYNYKHGESNRIQIYVADTDNKLYVRTLNSSSWTNWNEVSTHTDLQEAISELTKSLFVMYYDGKEADTTTTNKPVANKALLLGEKGKLKGLTLFDEKDGKIDQLLIDTLSLPRIVDAKNKPEEKENALKILNELKTGELVIIDYMTLVRHLNNLADDEYSAVASLNRDVVFVKNERSLVSLETFSYLKYGFNLALHTFDLQMLRRSDDYVFTTNSINSSQFDININNQQITVGDKHLNVPQINTPLGTSENLMIDNSTQYVDQAKVTTALNNLGLDTTDILNIAQDSDQSRIYNNSNLIIKLDEVNSKLNGNKRIFYLADNNNDPQEKQAIMKLPDIMNDGDIVFIEFFTVNDKLSEIEDDFKSAIQGESKSIAFVKDNNGIISIKNWYWLETSKYNDNNYLTLNSSNIILNVTKDNYNFQGYSMTSSQVILP